MFALFRLVDVTPQQVRRRRILRTGLGPLCGARAARQRLNSHGKNEAVQSLFLTMILQERGFCSFFLDRCMRSMNINRCGDNRERDLENPIGAAVS